MRRVSLAALAVLSAALCCGVALAARPEPFPWRTWNTGMKEAGSSGRIVLVDVYTDWCGWCKRLDADVYSRSEVRRYLAQHFVTIRLNAESGAPASYEGQPFTERSLAGRFRVNSYPTTIFLRPNGDHMVNVPGYVPADRFLLLLRYIGDGHADRGEPFEEFCRSQADSSAGRD